MVYSFGIIAGSGFDGGADQWRRVAINDRVGD